MTQIVRSIASELLGPDTSSSSQWQFRFLLRKLNLRRSERVWVYGRPERDVIADLADAVGPQGKVALLCEDSGPSVSHVEFDNRLSQVELMLAGPSADSQQCDAVVILPDWLNEPYQPLLDAAWRRLGNGGRLMLVLPEHEDNSKELRKLVDMACQLGFVSRYRRCCDKHCAWVGVKYAR
ncbi:hypothetical protein [Ferrimonas pelagia]|uniref:Methyltransferase n=1 Tax=Ferrimonas pelagia TaxID=1177826 RepID=A0ABP9F9C3_9GAMM